ncbi:MULTISPECIES: chain length determinant protein EpsF [unclassified Methylibium]|uniref:chain length determinant protein EpsF n=1 Tax=unclassified Methylibium TaxID=2633235 RepID=UPI0004AFD293|nr:MULTISPECIES: chain length determinant protein EpsF [unclassified Methylibium]
MTLAHFLSVLRARWAVCMLVLGLTLVTTIVVSVLLPKQYVATAAVVVEFRPDPVGGAMNQYLPPVAYMATQTDILKSSKVTERVIKELQLSSNPQLRAEWQESSGGEGSIDSWLVEALQKNLTVTPSRESSVINVSYAATDPQVAADMANSFVKSYVDTSLDMRTNPAKNYTGFFESRSKELRDALDHSRAKLSEFQREKGITATDERFDIENARLSELSSQLVMVQAMSAESSSRSMQAGSSSADRLQEVLTNPVIGGLKSDLSRAEARLKELNSRLGDNHPQVVEAKASISEVRARLDAETRRVTGGVGVANTINRQREAELRAALELQRSRVIKLKAQREESAVLQRDVEAAQKAYESVVGRLNQSSLESQTTQSNILALSEAVPPSKPTSPKLLLNIALAIFFGSFLAVGAAMAMESADRRLRINQDIVEMIGLPVLGVLPAPNRRALDHGRSRMPLLSSARNVKALNSAGSN